MVTVSIACFVWRTRHCEYGRAGWSLLLVTSHAHGASDYLENEWAFCLDISFSGGLLYVRWAFARKPLFTPSVEEGVCFFL